MNRLSVGPVTIKDGRQSWNLLDDLGSDDLARAAPGGEAVENDELRLLQGVVPVGLAGK